MKLQFFDPGADYMVDHIMYFQTEGETPYWSDALFYFFPQLDGEKVRGMSFQEKDAYIRGVLTGVYEENRPLIAEKVDKYNAHFLMHHRQIEDALSDAFGIEVSGIFNDMKAYISLNPVSPRFLDTNTFDVFYLNSERGALGISIHEIIHFIWFHVWNGIFHDSYDEYERPNLKWILSEMVVESIMRDERLSDINPYFPRENGGCVYGYFQDMVIDGAPILDTLDEMYRKMPMPEFMKAGYEYCLKHEEAIRKHIEIAEQGSAK